jgi:poly-gamma-glutamate synthesis protein (capsule biosynthesis protein)
MSSHAVSGPLAWRARAVTVVIAVAALGLFTAGCGGTQPSASAVPRPPPGGTSASPARPLPTATMTTQGPAPATAASQTPSAPVTSSPAGAVFQASTSALTAAMRNRMTGVSWHPGCPVPLSALRLLRLSYWGFDHAVHQGELIVNTSAAASLTQAFAVLFAARFPIRQMRVVDDFGGDDEHSMLADNTSAFNCRLVPGTSVWAQHAYGLAVDINPFENPEIQDGQVDPSAAAPWADRSRVSPAMITEADAAWRAFRAIGWTWGGDWRSLKDYMHFSANGL